MESTDCTHWRRWALVFVAVLLHDLMQKEMLLSLVVAARSQSTSVTA